MANSVKVAGGGFCGCAIAFVVFNLAIGGLLFDYSLWAYFHKDVPWYIDVLVGLFLAELLIPAAAVAFLLNIGGLAFPLFG